MERIFLVVFCISGWSVPFCLTRQFHYVAEPLNWTEAQTYCRQSYTDLATIDSLEEMKQFNKTVLLSGLNSEVWIGLYRKMYKWSDGYTGDEYSKLAPSYHSKHLTGSEFCIVLVNGEFYDAPCSFNLTFFCYRGSQQDPEFVFVDQSVSWFTAQRICRERYADLATVKNDEEYQKIKSMNTSGQNPWIGLYRAPHDYWSDGSSSEVRYLDEVTDNSLIRSIMCGAADPESSGKWRLLFCESRLPFVCYSVPKPGIRRQIIKLKIRPEDPSLDLNKPGVKADFLKKLQEKLKERGVDGVTLKWREQPDGKVFHREGESSEEERKKRKSEL